MTGVQTCALPILRGSVPITYSLAERGANRLWRLLHDEPFVNALGAVTGNQAMQMVRAGLKAIYLSGWQVAADANTAGAVYPDQSLYPADSGPDLARRINRALQRADQLQPMEATAAPHWFAPLAADAAFPRRSPPGLTGPLPTREQTQLFLDGVDPDKRQKLIDKLLASPEYARHMQQTFDVILMRRLPAKNVSAAEWQTFLQTAFAENKPYNQIVAEILSADGSDLKNRGPARFYLDRNGDTNSITRDIARVFLGRNLECAQCHDHPEVDDYLQSHFYGISAFLVRSYIFKDPKLKKVVFAEKAEGEVKFRSVFVESKKDSTTPPRVIDGKPFPDPEIKKADLYVVKPAKNVRPVPKYSRRSLIDEAIGSAQNRRFARTAANRFWSILMGRGLVHPIDFDHSANPPSHPELLDLLTDELIAHKFDVKGLLRELALSTTYQASRAEGRRVGKE